MADFLIQGSLFNQGTSSPTIVYDLLLTNNEIQNTSSACVVDLTPPTFAGISSLTVESRGQIRAKWLAASDPTAPIRYEIYIKANNNISLFTSINLIAITDKLQYDTFTLPDGSFLQNGTTYYVGVRAIDGVNNRDNNIVNLSVISTGVMVSADEYNAEGAFAINKNNQLQGTLWCLKNSTLATSLNSVLGLASYQIYDKNGSLVSGMSEIGISADTNGQYKITPVASTLNLTLDHYLVKVTINIDGADRVDYISLIEPVPEYEVHGSFSLDISNELNATFWASADDEAVTNVARLGTASYQVYDKDGVAVSGMSESGIPADANGLFKITPVLSSLDNESTHYSVKVTVIVDNVARTNFLPILGKIPVYGIKGVFSVNKTNQFQGTLWAHKDSVICTSSNSSMGVASYQVYDKAGVAVSGMSGSGISADANGQFKITPVVSSLDLKLEHYVVKITVNVDGVDRTDYIPLLEKTPEYEIRASYTVNSVDQMVSTIWVVADGEFVSDLTRLGTASYTVYDKDGVLLPMSESGMTANASGLYQITPFALSGANISGWKGVVTVNVDGVPRTSIIAVAPMPVSYEPKAVFSINALNQFQATLWVVEDGKVKTTSLGVANYTVYDKDGVAVAGLTESGIAADVNGRFKTTPVSAILLTDLTHYTVKIGIVADGIERISYRGFTLLGT